VLTCRRLSPASLPEGTSHDSLGGEGVSLRGFGSFYVRAERDSWVFKFNPSQRLRALFGWSSTYRGPL
jgi:hypothetical protein